MATIHVLQREYVLIISTSNIYITKYKLYIVNIITILLKSKSRYIAYHF